MPVRSDQREVRRQSNYLEYLPAFFREDETMGRFLLIFEDILQPIENAVGNLDLYFDPSLTSEPLLIWLASWLGLVLDSALPIERRRELVKSAAELYRWRGTKRGLSEYLRIYTGNTPEISEHIAGMRLGSDTRLGVNTHLGSSGKGFHFTVTLDLDVGSGITANTLKSIVEAQKPAHAIYTLIVTEKSAGKTG